MSRRYKLLHIVFKFDPGINIYKISCSEQIQDI